MRVVECREFGPVDRLVVVERDAVSLGPRQVRIEVAACGVNYVDGLFVQGNYQIKPPLPFVPGVESDPRRSTWAPRSARTGNIW